MATHPIFRLLSTLDSREWKDLTKLIHMEGRKNSDTVKLFDLLRKSKPDFPNVEYIRHQLFPGIKRKAELNKLFILKLKVEQYLAVQNLSNRHLPTNNLLSNDNR